MARINHPVAEYGVKHYTVHIPRQMGDTEFSVSICSLCGNTGIIPLQERRTPWGHPIPEETQFCICPNGQTDRAHAKRKPKTP